MMLHRLCQARDLMEQALAMLDEVSELDATPYLASALHALSGSLEKAEASAIQAREHASLQ